MTINIDKLVADAEEQVYCDGALARWLERRENSRLAALLGKGGALHRELSEALGRGAA